MTEQNKLSSELEEQVQILAGDIYIQIEETISSFLTHLPKDKTLSEDDILQHKLYLELIESHDVALNKIKNLNQDHTQQLKNQTKEIESLKNTIAEQANDIQNNSELNTAKLTDTEQVLKEKLKEISALTTQLTLSTNNESNLTDTLSKQQIATKELDSAHKLLQQSEQSSQKDIKAKTATLEIQNQQISQLRHQLDESDAQLAHIKAQQTQVISSASEELSQEKHQVNVLADQKFSIEKELNDVKRSLVLSEQTLSQKEARLKKSDEDNEVLNKKLTTSQEKSENFEQQIKVLSEELTANKGQIDQLNKTSESQELSAQAQYNKAEQAEATALENIAELQQQLLNLQLEHRNTSELLANKTEQVELLLTKEQALEKSYLDLQQTKEQEQHTAEQNFNALDAKHSQVIQDLQAQLLAVNEENKNNASRVVSLEKVTVNYQEQIARLSETALSMEKVTTEDKQLIERLQNQVEKDQQALSNQTQTWQLKLENLTSSLTTSEEKSTQLQEKIEQLEQQAVVVEQRVNESKAYSDAHKEKQEIEYNKARETIKYLRDENLELSSKLDEQVSELEDKLTEYRLRFEYAQKQLAKNNAQ